MQVVKPGTRIELTRSESTMSSSVIVSRVVALSAAGAPTSATATSDEDAGLSTSIELVADDSSIELSRPCSGATTLRTWIHLYTIKQSMSSTVDWVAGATGLGAGLWASFLWALRAALGVAVPVVVAAMPVQGIVLSAGTAGVAVLAPLEICRAVVP